MFKGKISKIIIVMAILLAGSTLAKAVTVEEATTSDYMKNQGHSPDIVRMVEIQKTRVADQKCEPNYPNYHIGKVKLPGRVSNFLKNLFLSDPTAYTREFGTN